MSHPSQPPQWRKSSRTNGQYACVEVANLPGAMAVRDSKNPDGGMLTIDMQGWSAFVAGIRNDEFPG